MSSYKPIDAVSAPTLQDTIYSMDSEPFTSAPPIKFLKSYSETITISSTLFDPTRPQLSVTSPVSYRVQRSYTNLSEQIIKLRHNRNTVDMEIFIDTYNLVREKDIVLNYSPNPSIPRLQPGDRYERRTSCYIFQAIEVPPSSSLVWDGRYNLCVDYKGFEVSSSSRLFPLRERVKSALNNADPTDFINLSGAANTIQPPQSDPYEAIFRLKVEEFLSLYYNSLALPSIPTRSEVPDTISVRVPAPETKVGTGDFAYTSTSIAAVLQDDYFVKWVNLVRYDEGVRGNIIPTTYISSTDKEEDGDDIVEFTS